MKELGNADKQDVGRWASNRVENSYLSFRRRERAMLRLRRMKTLQKFASVTPTSTTTSISNATSSTVKPKRNAALPPWQSGRSSRAKPLPSKLHVHRAESGSRLSDSTLCLL